VAALFPANRKNEEKSKWKKFVDVAGADDHTPHITFWSWFSIVGTLAAGSRLLLRPLLATQLLFPLEVPLPPPDLPGPLHKVGDVLHADAALVLDALQAAALGGHAGLPDPGLLLRLGVRKRLVALRILQWRRLATYHTYSSLHKWGCFHFLRIERSGI